MEQRLSEIERRLGALARRVDEIEGRLAAGASAAPPTSEADLPDLALPPFADLALTLGRGCLVLAGAYLLRSLTAGAYWPHPVGVSAGLAYAVLAWFAAAHAASKSRQLSAAMYAACASLVAFPLLWENSGSPNTLSYQTAAFCWAAFAGAGLAVGVRHQRPAVLVGTFAIGFPIGIALLLRSGAAWPLLGALLIVAVATLAFARGRLPAGLVWTPAWLVIGVVGFLCVGGLMPRAPDWLQPIRLAALQWAFIATYVGYFVFLAFGDHRPGAADSAAFAPVALVAALSSRLPWPEPHEARAMVLAAAGVAVAGFWLARRASPASRWLWHGAAAALLLDSTANAVSGTPREIVWSALAVGAAILHRRIGLAWTAPIFGGALAWTSGLVALGIGATEPMSLAPGSLPHVLAAALVLALIFLALSRDAKVGSNAGTGTCVLSLVTVGISATAFIAIAAARSVLPFPLFATARLAVPTAAALSVLLAYRWTGYAGARIVGLTAVVAAGLQVIARDLLAGSPRHQLAGLVTLGIGLIAATVLLRRERS